MMRPGTLRDGTGELDEGVADLLAGIITLNDGAPGDEGRYR